MDKQPKLPGTAGYEVGYGRPPKTKQFKRGQSGNPKGRPRGARNKPAKGLTKLRDMLLSEAAREVIIQDREGPLSLPIAQAAMRSLGLKAAQGNVGAQKLFLSSVASAEADREREDLEILQAAVEYKKDAYAEIERRKRKGDERSDDILPHPDHIEVNARTGKVLFTGPMDESEKKQWDDMWARKADFEEEIESYGTLLADPEASEETRQFVQDDLKLTMFMLQTAEQAIIIRWQRPVREVIKDWRRWKETEQRIKIGKWPQKPSG